MIERIQREIATCVAAQSDPRYDARDRAGAFLGEMDWRAELSIEEEEVRLRHYKMLWDRTMPRTIDQRQRFLLRALNHWLWHNPDTMGEKALRAITQCYFRISREAVNESVL